MSRYPKRPVIAHTEPDTACPHCGGGVEEVRSWRKLKSNEPRRLYRVRLCIAGCWSRSEKFYTTAEAGR